MKGQLDKQRGRMGTLMAVCRRELRRWTTDSTYFFAFLVAPVCSFLFFATLMWEGTPTDMPVGVVDMDNSSVSRNLARTIDAFEMTHVVSHYTNMSQATDAMRRGQIYGFFYIPRHFSADANKQVQPKVSFYTNNSVMIAASFSMKDFRMVSELASGAAQQKVLRAKGFAPSQHMPIIQPIVVDPHPLGNPWLSYNLYANSIIMPGLIMLMTLLMTVYGIASELKRQTSRQLMELTNGSAGLALVGKLLPQTAVFSLIGLVCYVVLYGWLGFPLHSGALPMFLGLFLLIISSQALGAFFVGMIPAMRLGMSAATLWGMVSFSIAGFSFPILGMHPTLQALCNLFPLHHYYSIYADQALNGYPMQSTWMGYVALLAFALLPIFVLRRLKHALLHYEYIP